MQYRSGKIVNKRELAELHGVSPQAIDGWLSRGCPYIKKGGPLVGYEFDTAQVSEWRVEQRVAEAIGDRRPDGEEDGLKRKINAEAALAELKLAREVGHLVSIDDVAKVWTQIFSTVRTKLLGLPSKIAKAVHGADSPEDIRAESEREIHEVLNDIAEAGISEDSSCGDFGISEGGESVPFDHQASAEVDAEPVGGGSGEGSVGQRNTRKVSSRKRGLSKRNP